jgi:archaellin
MVVVAIVSLLVLLPMSRFARQKGQDPGTQRDTGGAVGVLTNY